uniref:J domain-containing protein n=1 Tax=Calidris pygmaea TaxID=425635 RepID=A0A8C3J9R3_9CHAR
GAGLFLRLLWIRLLAMAEVPEEELNPFQVLGVEATASDAELKKAYRRLAVLVHPDKNHHPRAEAAFKVLRAAWDIVTLWGGHTTQGEAVGTPPPKRRLSLGFPPPHRKRMAESELTRSMSEFLSRLQDDLKEAMNTMMCSKFQPPGAEDHLLRHDGRQDLRHHGWVCTPKHTHTHTHLRTPPGAPDG